MAVFAIVFHEAPTTGTVPDEFIARACTVAAGYYLFTSYDITGESIKRFVAEVVGKMSDLVNSTDN